MRTTIRHYPICKPRFALLLLLALAGLAATNMLHSQRAEAAGGDPIIHWDSSMIYPGQNNGYPWGPVGEQVRIHGEKFTAGEVVGQAIKLALLQGDVNNPPGGGSSMSFANSRGRSFRLARRLWMVQAHSTSTLHGQPPQVPACTAFAPITRWTAFPSAISMTAHSLCLPATRRALRSRTPQ